MSKYVLDASALLVLLNREPRYEQVERLLEDSAISSVNLCEVVTKLIDCGLTVSEIRPELEALALEVIPFDQTIAFEAAALRTATRAAGLSLGDRACLGLARTTGHIAVTSDRSWGKLRTDVKVQLLRG